MRSRWFFVFLGVGLTCWVRPGVAAFYPLEGGESAAFIVLGTQDSSADSLASSCDQLLSTYRAAAVSTDSQAALVFADAASEQGSAHGAFVMALARGVVGAHRIAERHWRQWIPSSVQGVAGAVLSRSGMVTGLHFETESGFLKFMDHGGVAVFAQMHYSAVSFRQWAYPSPQSLERLSALQGLRVLNLENNEINAAGAAAIAQSVELRVLQLRWNPIGPRGAEALARLQHLEHLDLAFGRDGVVIGSEGAVALSGLKKIKRLNLHSNHIGYIGAEAVAQMRGLNELDLGANGITSSGARVLARLPRVEVLDLSGNPIQDLGATAVAQMLSLRNLNLHSCQITSQGATALSALHGLEELHLHANRISDFSGLDVDQMPKLRHVSTERNGPYFLPTEDSRIAKKMAERNRKPQAGVVVLIRRGAGGAARAGVGVHDEFLFVKRAPAKEDGGLWSMVSGKVDAGEAQADTVVRELYEELGVRARAGRMLFSKVTASGKYELFWWSAELEPGEVPRIAAPDENTEFAWLTLAQLQALEAQGLTYPRATEFLKQLLTR